MNRFYISLVLLLCSISIIPAKAQQSYTPNIVKPILDDQQYKAFTYFINYTDPASCLAYEGDQRGYNVITIGGSGFGVMSIIVGVERGWISRRDAASRVQKMVRFLATAERVHGVWSHWVNTDGTIASFGESQVKAGDLVETSFMMAGLLAAREYFDTSDPIEVEIRDKVNLFWNEIDWKFYTNNKDVLYWAFDEGRPNDGDNRWVLELRGWNEGLITYLLALAAPLEHAIPVSAYSNGWLNGENMYTLTNVQYGYPYALDRDKGGPLFLSQYSFLGLDPRLMQDNQVFYWQQQVAHVMINRAYCLSDAPAAFAYDEQNWGLTACYGVDDIRSYLARHPNDDDGIIAPTAAVSSIAYTPYYALQVLLNLAQNPSMQTTYGLVDAYAPADGLTAAKNLAIDQGPIVVMIENYRSGLIWNLLMKAPEIQSGLAKAGITVPTLNSGFPLVIKNEQTHEYDMVRHPDKDIYELPYYVQNTTPVLFKLKDTGNNVIRKFYSSPTQAGNNICSFSEDCNVLAGNQYTIEMYADGGVYTLPVHLR